MNGGGPSAPLPPPTNGDHYRPNFMHFLPRRRPNDEAGASGHVKLYVAAVPRTATVDDIRPVFEYHGRVIEVVLFRDKVTGQQQGACFVKYATLEEAQRAIQALDNQYTFPGEMHALRIKFAEGKREGIGNFQSRSEQERFGNFQTRLASGEQEQLGNFQPRFSDGEHEKHGTTQDKLYVGCVNKFASKFEIAEIFSLYGRVEDVFIVRDERKQSRGCAFVKYSHRDMALAAISALHGRYVMRGCDQPLVVRFADPKKPRIGEPRAHHAFSGQSFGPSFQEPIARPALGFGDPMVGHIPHAPYPTQQVPRSSPPVALSSMPNQGPLAHCMAGASSLERPPSSFSAMPSQHTQVTQNSVNPPEHATTSLPSTSVQHLPFARVESPKDEKNPNSGAIYEIPSSPECDWSEHTCPEGNKYYYNCVTRESMWKKPEEFVLYQQQLEKQQRRAGSTESFNSLSPVDSTSSGPRTSQELDRGKAQSETSPVVGPTRA